MDLYRMWVVASVVFVVVIATPVSTITTCASVAPLLRSASSGVVPNQVFPKSPSGCFDLFYRK